MAQYDLVLIQNVHASGIEYTERIINLAKGGLLSANASGVPTVLPIGTDTYHLVADSAEATGMKWIPVDAGHTQNTDIGTTSNIFELDSDGFKIELTAESASKMGVKVDGGASYADLQAKDATFNKVTLTLGTISTAPSGSTDIVNKAYADALIAANNAMVFRGTIGVGGTHEITDFNALATYNTGWNYKIITAGTIKGKVCEVGDSIYATITRAGTGQLDSDWCVIQANLDGVVIGPASATDGYLVLFDGATGKLIKAGTGAPGTMVYANTADYVAKALFNANTILAATTDNTPAAVTIAEQTLVGRKTGGAIGGLTPAEAMNVLWSAVPASKTATGIAGQIAKDANYMYICTATDTWKRFIMATNWS